MKTNYEVLKILEKKATRFTALIKYKEKKAILKQLTTKNTSLVKRFSNEIDTLNALNTLNKKYIPIIYEYGVDYLIMEYFEAYDNKPAIFVKYVNDTIIDKIIAQLIDIKLTILNTDKMYENQFLLAPYKVILKLWINKYFRFYHLKLIFLMTLLYIKNVTLFKLPVSTKGDFTEVNILVKDDAVKFIDFDNYTSKGAWLQDASYLLLHQDVKIEELSWQKIFYKKYIEKIDRQYLNLNRDYVRFWLLRTSIHQFSIRFYQKKYKLIKLKNDELNIKEEHIKYFLNTQKFNQFLLEIGMK